MNKPTVCYVCRKNNVTLRLSKTCSLKCSSKIMEFEGGLSYREIKKRMKNEISASRASAKI